MRDCIRTKTMREREKGNRWRERRCGVGMRVARERENERTEKERLIVMSMISKVRETQDGILQKSNIGQCL